MIRGIYSAASGMVTGLLRQETISHNLSNMETVGYKQRVAIVRDFPSLLLARLSGGGSAAGPGGPNVGALGTGVNVEDVVTDWSVGPLQQTDHLMDLALGSDGFFRVQTPDGVRYTRDGRFRRDSSSRIVSSDGYPLLGADGPITLPDGDPFIAEDGTVTVGDTVVGKIDVASFAQPDLLERVGENLFSAPAGVESAPAPARIMQGYLEQSNVDPTTAMLEMMNVARAYEASQRMVQTQSSVLQKAVTEVGRV